MKKFFAGALIFIYIMFVFISPAYAYIDPSVTSFAIQAVVGIVIAVGAVVGIVWRKTKKKIKDKLGIDENAKKEAEADVVEFRDDDKDK